MKKTVKSGIDVIDFAAGGLREGESYLINGDTGTGKTIMALQFLHEGIRQDEFGLYITDDRPKNLLFQGKSLGMDFHSAIRRGAVRFLELPENYAHKINRNTDILLLVKDLKSHIEELHIKRLAIDTFGSLIHLNQSPPFCQGFAGSLLNFICDLPSINFLIGSSPVTEAEKWHQRLLERAVFGIFHLGWDNEKSLKYLTVKKMRGTSIDQSPQYFTIEDGFGIRRCRLDNTPSHTVGERSADRSNHKILTIGLDKSYVEEITKSFGEGWEIRAVTDGVQGVGEIEKTPPVLVVMDSGSNPARMLENVQTIRGRGHDLPILVISSDPTRITDRIKALKRGVDEFADGPLRIDELKARILSLLRRAGLLDDDDHSGERSEVQAPVGHEAGREADLLSTDLPSLHYDMDRQAFVMTKDQKRRVLINIDMVDELDVHFSLTIMKFTIGSGDDKLVEEDLLELVTEIVISQCREEDIIVRAQGDEIILILTGADTMGVKKFFNRIERNLSEILRTRTNESISCSYGFASFPQDSDRYEDIVDLALGSLNNSLKVELV